MIDSQALGRVIVTSPTNEIVPLGELWAARTVVLALVRQFG